MGWLARRRARKAHTERQELARLFELCNAAGVGELKIGDRLVVIFRPDMAPPAAPLQLVKTVQPPADTQDTPAAPEEKRTFRLTSRADPERDNEEEPPYDVMTDPVLYGAGGVPYLQDEVPLEEFERKKDMRKGE